MVRQIVLLCLALVTNQVLAQTPANDNKASAVTLTNLASCTAAQAYTNVGATTDGSGSSCGTMNNNVWFRFQATTQYIKIEVKTGSDEGTIRYPQMSLWNSSNVEVACQTYTGSAGDIVLEKIDLVIGEWYYISVSTNYSSSTEEGTFTLCANNLRPNDDKVAAWVLPNKTNWCSAPEAYNNISATPDGGSSTCGSPENNVWFQFQASTQYIKVDVKTGTGEGTIQYPELALWTEGGAQVVCQAHTGSTGDVSIEKLDLVIGQTYYISVSTNYSGASYEGTFTLCANDIRPNNDKVAAWVLPSKTNWCSAPEAYNNIGATPDGASSTCGSPENNVWFKFQASTQYIKVDVKTGTGEGTIQYPELALWTEGGAQVVCQAHTGSSGDVSLEKLDLVIGQMYYISISTNYSGASYEGTFTLCANDIRPNNDKVAAWLLPGTSNWCSAPEAYNNIGATPDEASSTCGSPENNVWFKFQASTQYIKVDVKTGTGEGTIQYPELTLWTESGTQLACQGYTGSAGDVSVEKLDLVIGQTYYISVSTNYSGASYEGTFTLCANNIRPNNDKVAAYELSQKTNWCSAPAAYHNVGATADGSTGACGTPHNNVWFKFQATTQYIKVEVKTGGTEGTIESPELALWNANNTEVICANSTGSAGDVAIEKVDLTIGQWYYISVHTASSSASNQGTFTLCLNDLRPNNDKVAAWQLDSKGNWCSEPAQYTNVNATADGSSSGTCSDPNNNVWFKFTAATSYIRIEVKTGGTEGTIQYPELTLWNSTGSSVLCQSHTGQTGDVSLEKLDLTVGATYHVSVSTHYSSSAYQGTFTLCINDQIPNNYKSAAKLLSSKDHWCSPDGAYHNFNATLDGTTPSCGTPNNNVWFKFQAATPYVKIDVKTGDSEGTIQYPEIALWNSSNTLVTCVEYESQYGDISLERTDLVVGTTYYLSVSTNSSSTSHQGLFTLCINDKSSFDHKPGALVLADKNNWCSGPAAYTSVDATSSTSSSACSQSHYNDVWFKFKAQTSYIRLTVKSDDDSGIQYGTARNPRIVLWDSLGNSLACPTVDHDGYSTVEKLNLTVGNWYYASVSTPYSSQSYTGTFTICANDQMPYDHKAAAIVLTDKNNWCSGLAAYNNHHSTPDGGSSSCGAPNNNVWFKFNASTTYIDLQVKTGGEEGTLGSAELTLWNSSGSVVACTGSSGISADVRIVKTDLVPGDYYVSVSTDDDYSFRQGSFTFCINDQIANNFKGGAIDLATRDHWCSDPGAYDNFDATPDGTAGACATTNNNVWFRFTATTNYVKIDVKTGSGLGSIRYPELTLYDGHGTAIACRSDDGSGLISVESLTLQPGMTYFLAVSTRYSSQSYQGTFKLCINDQVDYNFQAAAMPLDQKSEWCSDLQMFSTTEATTDGTAITCGTLHNNVWFKFMASTPYMKIDVKTGGDEGTIRYPEVALFNNAMVAVECVNAAGGLLDVSLIAEDLTVGEWYYITVYGRYSDPGNLGTFSLCLDDRCQQPPTLFSTSDGGTACPGMETSWITIADSQE
ncbi:MAG TPA: hypothetical protein VEB86_07905, partial [Chryseosolibacter sp.]|nr:hypothetical protein [Chryseosolibacter sp.]